MATSVGLAMIVRNEEANLPACLESVRGLFDQTVIVDTGSTDATVKIARRYWADVFRFEWCDDFSAARNFGLDRVRTDYVFRLDADDRLPPGQRKRLKRLLAGLRADQPTAYACRVSSTEEGGQRSVSDEWRLWPHAPGRYFDGAVHERIRIEDWGVPMVQTDLSIVHSGYSNFAEVHAKQLRNLTILERELAVVPCDPFVLFDYGRTAFGLGMASQARDALTGFLRVRDRRYDMAARIAYRILVDIEIDRFPDDPRPALALAQAGLAEYPYDATLTLKVAGLLASVGANEEAAEGFRMALDRYHANRMDTGIAADFPQRVQAALAAVS